MKELMEPSFEVIMDQSIVNVNYCNPEAAKSNSTETILDDVLGEDGESDDSKILSWDLFCNPSTAISFFSTCPWRNASPEEKFGSLKAFNHRTDFEIGRKQQTDFDIQHNIVGPKSLLRSELERAPSWLLENTIREKVCSNWANAYEKDDWISISNHATVIWSHKTYKFKLENTERRLKARLCPHGERN